MTDTRSERVPGLPPRTTAGAYLRGWHGSLFRVKNSTEED